ncbi:MAG: hypothetical protein NTY90_05860 [Candidatus Micrarchaeota archaeon]|nr:hypothetical protein [Candidatus Micrarchaeota archaeon]
MAIYRVPEIKKEELDVIRSSSSHLPDILSRAHAANAGYHMLVNDKLGLAKEKREGLMKLDEHRMNLGKVAVAFMKGHPALDAVIGQQRREITPDFASKLLKAHRELVPEHAKDAEAGLNRLEAGGKPFDVLTERFVSEAIARCDQGVKKLLGDADYVVYRELHRQIEEKAIQIEENEEKAKTPGSPSQHPFFFVPSRKGSARVH